MWLCTRPAPLSALYSKGTAPYGHYRAEPILGFTLNLCEVHNYIVIEFYLGHCVIGPPS